MKIKLFIFLLISLITESGNSQVKYGFNNGKYLTILETKVYYEEYGKGIPLLLLHGGFGSIADFEKVIPKLSKKYRVIIPDSPGLGRSEYSKDKISYRLMAEYSSEIIEKLKLDSVYVLGWSDGGNTGLILAKNRPDKVKKLIVSGANYKIEGFKNVDEIRNYADTLWVEKNLKGWIKNYESKLPKRNWKKYVSEVGKIWFENQYFPKSDLEAINIPTLIIYGDNDMYSLEHGIEIHNAIKNSQFCVIPKCSHEVFWEKSDVITKIINDFIIGK